MTIMRDIHDALSTAEAASRYHVTRTYIGQLARKGVIKATKFGRDWIIDEISLRHYLTHPQKRGPKPGTKRATTQ
jgi:excisionase family DNA binding protein